ncbi:MAG: hypothetical protein WBZ33_10965 [Thermoactinomyces sp.]
MSKNSLSAVYDAKKVHCSERLRERIKLASRESLIRFFPFAVRFRFIRRQSSLKVC